MTGRQASCGTARSSAGGNYDLRSSSVGRLGCRSVENQATDRAFRIGQRRGVLVHKLVCRGTVEERIDAMLEEKRALSRDLLDEGGEVRLTELDDRWRQSGRPVPPRLLLCVRCSRAPAPSARHASGREHRASKGCSRRGS